MNLHRTIALLSALALAGPGCNFIPTPSPHEPSDGGAGAGVGTVDQAGTGDGPGGFVDTGAGSVDDTTDDGGGTPGGPGGETGGTEDTGTGGGTRADMTVDDTTVDGDDWGDGETDEGDDTGSDGGGCADAPVVAACDSGKKCPVLDTVSACLPDCVLVSADQCSLCISEGVPPLSGACLGCFVDYAICGGPPCLPPCMNDIYSDACADCKAENGCDNDLAACLAPEPPTSTDGEDSIGDDDGPGDTGPGDTGPGDGEPDADSGDGAPDGGPTDDGSGTSGVEPLAPCEEAMPLSESPPASWADEAICEVPACPPLHLVAGQLMDSAPLQCTIEALIGSAPARVVFLHDAPDGTPLLTETVSVLGDGRAISVGSTDEAHFIRRRQFLQSAEYFGDCEALDTDKAVFGCLMNWNSGCDETEAACPVSP